MLLWEIQGRLNRSRTEAHMITAGLEEAGRISLKLHKVTSFLVAYSDIAPFSGAIFDGIMAVPQIRVKDIQKPSPWYATQDISSY